MLAPLLVPLLVRPGVLLPLSWLPVCTAISTRPAAVAGVRPSSEMHGCACRQPSCMGKPPSQLPQSVQVPADDTARYGGWT